MVLHSYNCIKYNIQFNVNGYGSKPLAEWFVMHPKLIPPVVFILCILTYRPEQAVLLSSNAIERGYEWVGVPSRVATLAKTEPH